MLPSPAAVLHLREVFTVIDLVGDIGGVFPILVYLFSWFLTPYSYFRFVLKWAQKLYLAKSPTEVFKVKQLKNKLGKHKFKRYKMEMPDGLGDSSIRDEVKDHRPIRVTTCAGCFYYCISCCWCCCKRNKIVKLYRESSGHVQKDLSIEKQIKVLKDLKYFVKEKIMTAEDFYKVQHHRNNVIELEGAVEAKGIDFSPSPNDERRPLNSNMLTPSVIIPKFGDDMTTSVFLPVATK